MSMKRWEVLGQGDAKAPFVLRKVSAASDGRVLEVLKELYFENAADCEEAGAIVKAHMNRLRALLVSLAALATLFCSAPALAQPVGYCGTGRPCAVSGRLTLTGSGATCVAVDGNVLVVDCANNRVGINTTSPSVALDVTGAILASSAIGSSSGTVGLYVPTSTYISTTGNSQAGAFILSTATTNMFFGISSGFEMKLDATALYPSTNNGLDLGVSGTNTWQNAFISGAITSSQASGSNALALTTSGARIDLGAGSLDYIKSDGTGIVAGDGTSVGSQFAAYQVNTFNIVAQSTTAQFQFASPITAASATAGNSAFEFNTSNTLDNSDALLEVNNNGSNKASVFGNGDASFAGTATVAAAAVTGNLAASTFSTGNTATSGTKTLSGGTGTVTVTSGARCVCTNTSAATAVRCSVSGTTLTVTGSGTDTIAYFCMQ